MDDAVIIKVSGPRSHVNDLSSRGLDLQVDQPSTPLVQRGLAPPLLRDVRQRAIRLAKQQRVHVEPLAAHASNPLVKARARARDGPGHVLDERVVGDPQQRPTLEVRRHVGGVKQRRDGAVEGLVGAGWVWAAGAFAGAVWLGHDLGRVAEAVAVADEDALGGRGDGQVGKVHGGLAGAQDEHGGVLAKLRAGLEGGGVQDVGLGQLVRCLILMAAVMVNLSGGARDVEARNVRHKRHSVQTTADGHNMVVVGTMHVRAVTVNIVVVVSFVSGICGHNMAWLGGVCLNGLDSRGAVDVLPQIKLVGVGLQVVDILRRCEEVGLFFGDSEVGERREVLGGDKLEPQSQLSSAREW